MPDNQNRTTEAELSAIVLEILSESPTGSATIQQIMDEIPNRLELTDEDKIQSDTRPNEQVWEQRVRNIRSHHQNSGNYIAEGYLVAIDGGLAITALGRDHLQHGNAQSALPL